MHGFHNFQGTLGVFMHISHWNRIPNRVILLFQSQERHKSERKVTPLWIKDFAEPEDNPLRDSPFVPITHLCYIDTISTWEYPWHPHLEEYEITYVLEGSGTLMIGQNESPVREGDICMVTPGIFHRYTIPEGGSLKYFALRFPDRPQDGELQSFFSRLSPAASAPAASFAPSFREACRILQNPNVSLDSELVQIICLPILQLTRRIFANRSQTIPSRESYSASDIMRYITVHCDEHITLQSLGERFSISPSHLSRIFSNAFHCSPINYVITARMARATEYLGKTDKTVSEISRLVGYDNHFYFINLFTRRIGCSPTEYREQLASRDLPKRTTDLTWHTP